MNPENNGQLGAAEDKEVKDVVTQDKSRKKIAIGIMAGIVAVLAIAVIIGVSALGDSGKSVQEQLDLGNKYLEEMDYEQALVAYNAVLEIEPKCVEAYIGLADAYIGLGDRDAAYAALQAGYEATGDERLRDRLEELEKGESLEEEADSNIAAEDGWELVTFSFDPYEVKLMGYDVFGDHYAEISAAIEATMDRNPTYTPSGSRLYHYTDESTGLYVTGSFNDEDRGLDYGNNNTDYDTEPVVEGWSWHIDYDGDSLNGTDEGGFRLNLYPGESGIYYHPEHMVTVPFWPGDSYEILNQVMCIDDIKKMGRLDSRFTLEEDGSETYYFKSNLGNGQYSEGLYSEEDRVSWHRLRIYYEDGSVFEMFCEITSSGLINDCFYNSDFEELGYPAYLWEESNWEESY